jgi:methionine-rich copper-binding protein CopC
MRQSPKTLPKLVIVLFALATLLLNPTSAAAHSGVVSSNPAEGERLQKLPTEISITFSEELLVISDRTINTVTLANVDGTEVSLTDIKVEGNLLTAKVPTGEYPSGRYEMAYRIISADGHEVSAVITFSLNQPVVTGDEPADNPKGDDSSESGAIPLPIALALALLIAIGGFFLLERRRR